MSDDDDSGPRDMLGTMRQVYLDAMQTIQAEINDGAAFAQMTTVGLSLRVDQLKELFPKMQDAHFAYRQMNMLATDLIYDNARREYLKTLEKVELRIRQLNQGGIPRTQPLANSTMADAEGTVYRIESTRQPKIGKFDGTAANWVGFRDLFLAEVHTKNIDSVLKFVHLKDACIGKAAKILGNWTPSAANYELAWKKLLTKFDNDYQVVHSILDAWFSIPTSERRSTDHIETLLNAVENYQRELLNVVTSAELQEQMAIHSVTSRLDPETLDAWTQHRNRDKIGGLVSLDIMRQFLYYQSQVHARPSTAKATSHASSDRGRRSTQDSGPKGGQRSKPYDHPRQSTDKFQRDRPGFGPPAPCLMEGCDEIHYLGQCTKFKNWTIAERSKFVKEKQLCRCCLRPGHMSNVCGKRGCSDCPDAKPPHHFHLCFKQKQMQLKSETKQ